MRLSALKNGQIIVLSKEQTLVDLFHNNYLACMGDFKRVTGPALVQVPQVPWHLSIFKKGPFITCNFRKKLHFQWKI